MATHTQHMDMQTHGTENTDTFLARWHAAGQTHTFTLLDTCTDTEITPQAHKLSSTQACTVHCATTHATDKANVTWPFKSVHTHRATYTY